MNRWTSRKFLMSVGAQIAALVVLLNPTQGQAIVEIGQTVAALGVSLLSALGYVSNEASIDRLREAGEPAPLNKKP